MNQEAARILIEAFKSLQSERPEPGLLVEDATVVGLPDDPLMLIHFRDEARPDVPQGAWWDFHGFDVDLQDPVTVGGLVSAAGLAKTFLDELFNGSAKVLHERPRDAEVRAWGKLDAIVDNQLPPAY